MSAAETRGSCTATTRPTSAISGHEVKTFLDHHMSMPSIAEWKSRNKFYFLVILETFQGGNN